MAEVFRVCFPLLTYRVDRTQWIYTLPNGSQIVLMGLDEKERTEKILGLEFATVFFNECSQIKYSAVKMALTRLVERAEIKQTPEEIEAGVAPKFLKLKAIYDLNPGSSNHYAAQLFVKKVQPDTDSLPLMYPDNYQSCQISPYDNVDNLAPEALQELEALPEAERRRFLEGVFTDEVLNAMFKRDWIAKFRVKETADHLDRIIVSFDPSGSAAGDECGIVVAGRHDNEYYVIDDLSGHYEPTDAAIKALKACEDYQADALVYESNYGKNWVPATITATARELNRQGDLKSSHIHLEDVNVFRGKVLRAEPVANKYELGVVHHLGVFPELEDQLANFTYNWKREDDGSPDRLDALTMAITKLSETAPAQRSIGFGIVR